MAEKHGNLSINSENIFPIIKKWLYSDHDIFFRELISNGCDAITKLKKLDMMGEYSLIGTQNTLYVKISIKKRQLYFNHFFVMPIFPYCYYELLSMGYKQKLLLKTNFKNKFLRLVPHDYCRVTIFLSFLPLL